MLRLELEEHGLTRLVARGRSMRPWLIDGSLVEIEARKPQLGEVALCVDPEGVPVIHRVVARDSDGRLTTRGDASPEVDRPWEPDMVLGTMVQYQDRAGRWAPPPLRASRWWRLRVAITSRLPF